MVGSTSVFTNSTIWFLIKKPMVTSPGFLIFVYKNFIYFFILEVNFGLGKKRQLSPKWLSFFLFCG